jgi:hypothetical protein
MMGPCNKLQQLTTERKRMWEDEIGHHDSPGKIAET